MKRKIVFCLLVLAVTSCHKVEDHANKKSDAPQSNLTTEEFLARGLKKKMSQATMDYMNSRPQVDLEELKKHLTSEVNAQEKTESVWGLTSNRQVWKWNGSSWFMPNSAAGLDYIDVSNDGGGVWGISGTHIYKWNGTSWAEPNPAAGLYTITAVSGNVAMGIGGSGIPFVTYDGGLSWGYLGSISGLSQMNAMMGSSTEIAVAVQTYATGGTVSKRVMQCDYTTGAWSTISTPTVPKWVDRSVTTFGAVAAYFGWYITNTSGSASVYTNNPTGGYYQPNSAATLEMISALNKDVAWGLSANHVFKTTNAGGSWSEPNSAARLVFISVGYE